MHSGHFSEVPAEWYQAEKSVTVPLPADTGSAMAHPTLQTGFCYKLFSLRKGSRKLKVLNTMGCCWWDLLFFGGWVGGCSRKLLSSTKAAKPWTFQDTTFKTGKLCPLTADSQIALSLQPFRFRAGKLLDHHLFHLLFEVGRSRH